MEKEMKLTLIHGDCFNILPKIPTNSMDLILTDPPYNRGKFEHYDGLPDKEFWQYMEKWLKESFRILKEDGHLYFTCSQEQIWQYKEIAEKVGFKFKHLLIWFFNEPKVHMRTDVGWLRTYEPIMFFVKSNNYRKLNNDRRWTEGINNFDVCLYRSPHKVTKGINRKIHPTQKPVELYYKIIVKTTEENMTVLDPFLGSGAVMVACLQSNRNCVGIEINENYINLVKDRLNWGSTLGNVQFEFYTEASFFKKGRSGFGSVGKVAPSKAKPQESFLIQNTKK